MTEIAQTVSGAMKRHDFTSPEAAARVKARYRAEGRFRMYGLLAIIFAGLFVVVLLADIIRKGLPAFTEHRAVVEMTLDAAKIDPEGKREVASLRAGDYQALIKQAVDTEFPGVSDRRSRRLLDGLLSTGAPDDIRAAVISNPALIGTTIKAQLLLSDDADLYLKGTGTKTVTRSGSAPLKLTGEGSSVEISSKASELALALSDVKVGLAARATKIEAEALRVERSRGAKADAGLDSKIADLRAEAKALRDRANNKTGAETLETSYPSILVSIAGGVYKVTELSLDAAKAETLIPAKTATDVAAGSWQLRTLTTPESDRKVSDREVVWLEALKERGKIQSAFSTRFFVNGDSREPELAGIRGALTGTALTLLVTLALCLPIGVGAAIYLEEFAPKNRFTDILEVNINNLAAVPSIVFGLLGLAMFLNFLGLPRSAPLVGGLVLALLVLPTIIIASRAALKSVPPSIKEAALGVGASHQQAIFHHVLPLAMPGIMTGTIIGMAHALGETAPLLMIGMVAFIVEVPKTVVDASTVLPVQIFLWADLPELAFQAKTAAAIMVLLVFLFLMNGMAILMRRRFERRW